MTPGLLALKAPEPSLVAKMHPSLVDFHSATKLLREICFLVLWLKAKCDTIRGEICLSCRVLEELLIDE